MKINFQNNVFLNKLINNWKTAASKDEKRAGISFCGKNPDIRLASDIMRAARLDVPMFSPNYAQRFYKSTKAESKVQNRANRLCDMLRDRVLFGVRNLTIDTPKENLDSAKFYGLGHCYEKALAVMAELFSRGYDDTAMTGVVYKTNCLSKNGNESWMGAKKLDHVFITSSMNNKNLEKMEKRIVIDPWLDFVSTVPEAKAKYKDVYKDRIEYLEQTAIQNLKKRGMNPENYYIEKGLEFSDVVLDKNKINEIKNYLQQSA